MPFLGLTRNRTAERRIVANLIKELARIDSKLWRLPLERRQALVASMRDSCRVPPGNGDLDSNTIDHIIAKEGIQTGIAFREAALWISDAEAFIKQVGEKELDQYHKIDQEYDSVIRNIHESAQAFIAENGDAEIYQDSLTNQFDMQIPALGNAFLNAVYTNFELKIQEVVSRNGDDCHWGKVVPEQYESYLLLRKETNDGDKKRELLSILIAAVSKGSSVLSKLIR